MNYDRQDTKQTFFGHIYTYMYIHINIHMDGTKRLTCCAYAHRVKSSRQSIGSICVMSLLERQVSQMHMRNFKKLAAKI